VTRRTYGLSAFTMLVLVFLYAPIALVMVNAFNRDEFLDIVDEFCDRFAIRPPSA